MQVLVGCVNSQASLKVAYQQERGHGFESPEAKAWKVAALR